MESFLKLSSWLPGYKKKNVHDESKEVKVQGNYARYAIWAIYYKSLT